MLRENDLAANDAARLDHDVDAHLRPSGYTLSNLGAALSGASLQTRGAAIIRSRRLPEPSLMASAWHTLPGSVQDQIGTAALTHSFYSLAPEVPGRELTLLASRQCEEAASDALTRVDTLARAALPELYGTDEAEPEWAQSDTPMVFPDPLDAYGPTVMPPEVAAAAAVRSLRIPGLDDILQAWTRLSPDTQDRIGVQAVAIAFYGWLGDDSAQDPADRWLTDDASGDCEDRASKALNLIAGITEGAMPELYGTRGQDPEWARADSGHRPAPVAEDGAATIHSSPISLAIALHRRTWETLQASNDFLTATGKAHRKQLVWPAADAEDEALTDLLMLPCRDSADAADMVAHLRWYLAVGSQHPNRPSPAEADGALIAARMADLGLVLGEAVPEGAPLLAPEELLGLLTQHRAAWSAYREAAVAVMADIWDAVAPLSSAVHDTAEAVLRAACGDLAGAKALVAHAAWYAEELAAAGDDVADGLDYVARQLTARSGDLELFLSLGDGAVAADGGATRAA